MPSPEAQLREAAEHRGVPDYMIGGLVRYVLHGVPPGSFLTAVMENDLTGAYGRADEQNTAAMRAWVMLTYNDLPAGCHGSPEAVDGWLARQGLLGPIQAPHSTYVEDAA